MPFLLSEEQEHAAHENYQWSNAVMVLSVAVDQGEASDGHGKKDHKVLKGRIVNQLNTKNGETGKE